MDSVVKTPEELKKNQEQVEKKLKNEKQFSTKISMISTGLAQVWLSLTSCVGLLVLAAIQFIIAYGMIAHADKLDEKPSCEQIFCHHAGYDDPACSLDDPVSVISLRWHA
jgi:hypothetical protein